MLWSELKAALPASLPAVVIENIRRSTAHERHTERVEATQRSAREMAERVGTGSDHLAALILIADLFGVGGPGGLSGAGTRRLLCLGAGRWQANDGGAYAAAAIDALPELLHGGVVEYAACAFDQLPPAWVVPLVTAIVAVHCGGHLLPHTRDISMVRCENGVECIGPTGAVWARFVVHAENEASESRLSDWSATLNGACVALYRERGEG